MICDFFLPQPIICLLAYLSAGCWGAGVSSIFEVIAWLDSEMQKEKVRIIQTLLVS